MPILSVLALSFTAHAQSDTLSIILDEITLTEHRNVSAISGTMVQGITIDPKLMATYPKLFGHTDPLRYIQSLPGVSTNSGAEGGMHVQGGENSHNLVLISDVPIYNPIHLTGLFSIFNQEHLPKVRFSTSSSAPYLAAELSLDHADTIPVRISGSASLGLISAQGTVSVPFGSKTSLTLSARRTFINAVYGDILKFDGNPLHFGFTDANLTLMHQLDSHNTLDFNAFWSQDNGGCQYGLKGLDMYGQWGNSFASVRWNHKTEKLTATTSAYVTHTYLDGNLSQENISGNLTSHITQYALKSRIKLHHNIGIMADASYYDILPQLPVVNRNKPGTSVQDPQYVTQADVAVNKTFRAWNLDITPSLLVTGYREKERYATFNADPALTLEYDMYRRGQLTFETGMRHQYLVQTGLSNVGLPIEFWVASGRYFKPQESLFGTLSYDVRFLGGKYALTLQGYGKRLYNQIEYTGFAYDLLSRPYRFEDNIIICSGYNWGANIMIVKQAGRFTGWIGYSFNQSVREGDGINYPKLFHSSYERKHELNAVINYKTGRFDLCGMMVLASGVPYSPAKNLYVISNTVMVYYDEYNSSYLPPYMRIDLSATYNLKSRGPFSHGINLSVYNASAYPNYNMGYLRVDRDEQTVRYKLAKLIIPVIPSISYFCQF